MLLDRETSRSDSRLTSGPWSTDSGAAAGRGSTSRFAWRGPLVAAVAVVATALVSAAVVTLHGQAPEGGVGYASDTARSATLISSAAAGVLPKRDVDRVAFQCRGQWNDHVIRIDTLVIGATSNALCALNPKSGDVDSATLSGLGRLRAAFRGGGYIIGAVDDSVERATSESGGASPVALTFHALARLRVFALQAGNSGLVNIYSGSTIDTWEWDSA